jgi:hypothetical protein
MRNLPRREFLLQALAACGTAWAAPARLVEGGQSAPLDRAARAGTAYFGGNADAVRAIGEAYLQQLGREANRESMLAAARGTIGLIDRSRDEPGAIAAIVRAVRQDFERGRSVQVEGWILSRTEAEMCVLTLLTAGGE